MDENFLLLLLAPPFENINEKAQPNANNPSFVYHQGHGGLRWMLGSVSGLSLDLQYAQKSGGTVGENNGWEGE